MRTIYHEFESLEHLVATRLLPGGGDHPIRFVVFGGTGAVGGAAVLELCRIILLSQKCRDRPWRGEIYATGLSDQEISKFAGRLFLALGREHSVQQVEHLRHYRIDDCIDLRFSILRLVLPQDLREHVLRLKDEQGEQFDPEAVLYDYFHDQPKPFLEFVEHLGDETPDGGLLHAVAVAIPLPSVAAYTLGAIDRLAAEIETDVQTVQRIKADYLRSFMRGLAVIQQRYARRVMIAHTTAVGGMYRVDGGDAQIRLGFAHSALGKKLVDKKYFADTLTQLYIDHGFHVLVTAAAIGIDAVDFETRLPLDRGILRALKETAEKHDPPPAAPTDLESGDIRLFDAQSLRFDGPEDDDELLQFGASEEWTVDAAIRSGENGLFSVANCMALYNVMKVAIPEELAMVLVRFAVFGPERRRDWFQDKVCYYTETDNSHLAMRILDSYPQLEKAHLGAFAPQAFQALGSATHQARLHELGLVMLVLRLLELREQIGSLDENDLIAGAKDLDDFFWRNTRRPTFEDLEAIEIKRLAELLGLLCEVDGTESAGRLLGFDAAGDSAAHAEFLAALSVQIRRYLAAITSLGIPIIFRAADGEDRLLVGPYAAPLDSPLARRGDLRRRIDDAAKQHDVEFETMRDWTIANNGFVDLRPHALANRAQEPGPQLSDQVRRCDDADELDAWLDELRLGDYFTACGLVALRFRLDRLYGRVRQRQISLGTQETWKHLFPQDDAGRHLLVPGLIETVRMYSEGLGKVTGTEALWPGWGY